jgi:Mg-chelatase subunit ChlD
LNLSVDYPWWLLLGLVGIVSGVYGWSAMRGIPKFRRLLSVSSRVILFAILGIAMSGVYRVQQADNLAVIAVVDTSLSVQNFASFGDNDFGLPITIDAAARGFLAEASQQQEPDDQFGLISFDGRVQTVATPSKSQILDRVIDMDSIEGTDLVGALSLARNQFPPDTNARVILFSDGRSTSTGLNQIPTDIPIDVVPIRYSVTEEVIVESVELPSRSLPGSIVDVRVVIRSLGDSKGSILLTYNNEPVDLSENQEGITRPVELNAGIRVLVLPVKLGESRVHRFEAKYIPQLRSSTRAQSDQTSEYEGDTSLGNNQAGGVTLTSGDGRVLIVTEKDESGMTYADTLNSTIERAGWDVEMINPSAFPLDRLDLEAFDLIVLVNTPRDALQLEAEELLSSYTRDLGGGIIFVGGRDALGAGGWKGSEIEDLLPVKLDVADELIVPQVAVVLVLDSSGSMRRKVMGSTRSQQAIANESAVGAIEVLDEKDLVGVVSFSNAARKVIEIDRNDQPETSRSRIGSISSSGGTNMGSALNMARDMLEPVEANTKHVILLSDGESMNPEILPELATELGELGIKVSTIAVGDEADESGMKTIARLSGGVYYRVRNPSVLPRIFLKAIRIVRTPMVREGLVSPVVIENDSPATGLLTQLPQLGGLALTEQITDDPRISTPIVSEKNEPIFAYHQLELGRVAVFTSDVSRWASSWIESDVFASFWTNVVAWTMRTDQDNPGELSLIVNSTDATIVYNAIDQDDLPIDGLDITAQLYDDAGRSRQVRLTQVGSGQYKGEARDLDPGVHVVIASARQGDDQLQPTIAGMQINGVDEFKHLSADPDALIALADRTGGRVFDLGDPEGVNLFDREGMVVRTSLQPIWSTLIAVAFVMFLIDLAMRRVAFDRWISQAREEAIAVTKAVGSVEMQQVFASRQHAKATAAPTPDIDRSPMAKPAVTESVENEPQEQSAQDSNPLLAAKRRAREHFED